MYGRRYFDSAVSRNVYIRFIICEREIKTKELDKCFYVCIIHIYSYMRIKIFKYIRRNIFLKFLSVSIKLGYFLNAIWILCQSLYIDDTVYRNETIYIASDNFVPKSFFLCVCVFFIYLVCNPYQKTQV